MEMSVTSRTSMGTYLINWITICPMDTSTELELHFGEHEPFDPIARADYRYDSSMIEGFWCVRSDGVYLL